MGALAATDPEKNKKRAAQNEKKKSRMERVAMMWRSSLYICSRRRMKELWFNENTSVELSMIFTFAGWKKKE